MEYSFHVDIIVFVVGSLPACVHVRVWHDMHSDHLSMRLWHFSFVSNFIFDRVCLDMDGVDQWSSRIFWDILFGGLIFWLRFRRVLLRLF